MHGMVTKAGPEPGGLWLPCGTVIGGTRIIDTTPTNERLAHALQFLHAQP